MTRPRVPVLIATWLEPDHASRIARAEPERVEVLYEPELLPPPRYLGDHSAPARPLTGAQRARWAGLLARAEVAFDFDWEAPERLTERAPNLRWIQATSSGIGATMRRAGLLDSPIRVTNAAGVHAQALGEFALMASLYFLRDVPMLERRRVERRWERYCAREVAGATMLVFGLGKVGRRIAELAAAVGMRVIGVRRSPGGAPPPGVERVITAAELDDALGAVDVLVLSAPQTPDTFHVLDRRRLALLPEGAVVVNVGRGSLVDEAALIESLRAGRLRGAALDVFEEEPLPASSPLWDMPNVIVSPHSASTVPAENDRLVTLFVENLRRYLDDRPLVNLFTGG